MKATITFNLTDSFERGAFNRATKADGMAGAIVELDNHLRDLEKYHDQTVTGIDETRSLFREMLSDRGITLDELR